MNVYTTFGRPDHWIIEKKILVAKDTHPLEGKENSVNIWECEK